ncbi:TatD family hydrolase [Tessaracoccus flavus]|uniref:AraC family transcriptional regulator n=1 Tax=Tessaracoccus flavus TaxID=1610493 RepID=A0A1Q2CGR6_9ACTN|nr:TatD family hydrolase [Tessaracoccus flavus]AQP45250.1 AraC family transcriptional regulator [Tessaracoccus flavus]SDY51417.1 TatD DNase family protein [Tessaracoccus flavus]
MNLPDGLPRLPDPLPRPVIDNHTHLTSTLEYSGLDVGASIELAASVGVTRIIEVGCDVASARAAVEIASAHPSVAVAVALHPNDAARAYLKGGEGRLNSELAAIEELVSHPRVVSVGETGLDYYRTREPEARAAQEKAFRRHIGWAKDHGKTLMIHDRDAHDDILRVLDSEGAPDGFVMHCFSGDADFAAQCLQRGAYLSFPGVVTFGSADNLREAALATPMDRIMVETDAPYLTPKPERGRPNAPYLLPHTVRFLADLLDVDLAEFCDQLVTNTLAAYGEWGSDA